MLNVTIFSWLKGREGGSLLWFRAGVASVFSQIVDTLLFITIAFGTGAIGWLMAGQMFVKVALSIVLVPSLITIFVAIGRRLENRKDGVSGKRVSVMLDLDGRRIIKTKK